MAPSLVGGAIVPLAVYYLVRGYVGSDAPALAIAGVPAVLWVGIEWFRKHTLDPIGAIVLAGFVGGLAVSYALGGSSFVLKIRDAVLTSLLGTACLASVWLLPRPLMFYIGRALSAGDDPLRNQLFDDVWLVPSAPALFKAITVVWGLGLVCDAAARISLATLLPTGPFLAVSPVVAGVFLVAMFATTVLLYRRFVGQAADSRP